ncbi:archaellin/type IV pilin N-terminal domain-containing protein [Halorubrum sp. 2020YC2]|uniref:archaellin/type IV pilin N-terminal domain-containing protein n=1 Tax=Halorubrum sp. 2020YC2 TaxID=2836432 RepID=UPI001BE8538B|nr:archaellin/type IV pilin N-terminal domain-containing protein [Halorubrum sp. 2020YC2]QWC18834.1 flagellin [Halorubrum sp. 2020YC2]
MFEAITDEEQRGQVGIGTLIVFIAMVLVAAIAAGVLINTAGFLQTQAEATGEESTQQVSDRLQVVSQSGTFDDSVGDNGQIVELDFVLAQSPGASNIDLSETSVELIGESGQETFTLSTDSDGTGIDMFKGDNNVVFTDTSDRAQVTLGLDDTSSDVDNNAGDSAYVLEEGDSMTITFTTASGATTTTEIRVPSTVVSDSVRL